ncbi:MAG: M20/M25/M40 family metallo-hydrolase [Defluviicoccus sp.]|nr:M20/M25/M40 family metallo-hydrolase [Defluviicoccus sp.]
MTGETPGPPAPLSSRQQGWIASAFEAIDRDFLLGTLERAVAIPSRTGEERSLAEFFAETMNGRGIDASYQPMTRHRGNAIGRIAGSGGGGADLLFYGHLDTTFSADPREDAQMTGGRPRPDLEPRLQRGGDLLYGLGVQNPKGSTVCAIAALDAALRAGIPLKGRAGIGIAAGGIHKGPVEGLMRAYRGRRYQGFGVGCEYMLKHGLAADYCISTKPGYGIVWEEPGECWFRVTIMGELCYSGLRHIQPNRNPIVDAARVVPRIEDWIADYTKRHTRGQIAPQGTVGGIEAGWPFKPEFIPGICVLYVNIHTNAVTRPIELRRAFEALIADIRGDGIEIGVEMLLATPGSRTEPGNWIVRSASAAVEAVEGRPIVVGGLSGTTDGAILRGAGIPTARIGLPGMAEPEPGWPPMFDACRIGDLERLTRVYAHALVDTCTREREEMA